jgi:hypothetical protein
MMSKPSWIKSKWCRDDLNDKSVEFRIRAELENKLVPVSGNGRFRTLENPKGLIRIEIVVTRQKTYGQYEDTIFYCPQESEPFIKKNETGSKFDFSILEF